MGARFKSQPGQRNLVFRGIPQSLQENARNAFDFGHECYLPHNILIHHHQIIPR